MALPGLLRARLASAAAGSLTLLAFALPANAAAAPAWLSPVDLSAPGSDAREPEVAVDSAGNATAVWIRFNGANTIVQSALRPAGGAWSAAVDLSAPGRNASEPQIAVDPAGNATAVWSRSDGSHPIVQTAGRPAGGVWGAPHDLSAAGRDAGEARVAVDPAGNAAVVWTRFDGFNRVVQAATRAFGGAWTEAVPVSAAGENAESPQLAFDPSGTATAVWSRFDGSKSVIQSATATSGAGGAWSLPADVSAASDNAAEPQLAIDPAGNATAVWAGEEGSGSFVRSANRPPGGSWTTPVDLSTAGGDASEPQIAVDPAGNATAVWSRSASLTISIIQSSSRAPGGAWGPPADLSAGGQAIAGEPLVGVDDAGSAVAVWARSAATPTVIESAGRPATGGWSAPVLLSVIGKVSREPALATGLATGDGVAVWDRDDGANTIVQAAGHDVASPRLRASIPAIGTIGQPVSFSVSAFDVWSAIGPIGWGFGDGASGAGSAIAHTFGRPGAYPVSVTVADALGNQSSAAATITIFNKASAARNVRVRGRRALLRLHCPSPAGCMGTAKLIARLEFERHGRLLAKRRPIGSGAFAIPGPATTTVSVALTRTGAAQVRRAGRKGLKTQLTGPGVKHRVVLLRAS